MTHAWLFTGPPGSGRSVAARAFAAALLCPRRRLRRRAASAAPRSTAPTPTSTSSRTEGLSIKVEQARDLVAAGRAPPVGRALARASSSRTPTASPSAPADALLKALEEPTPRTVWMLCAPAPRGRHRHDPLAVAARAPAHPAGRGGRRPAPRRDGVDPPMALYAARAAQSHVGLARRLARDEQRPHPSPRRHRPGHARSSASATRSARPADLATIADGGVGGRRPASATPPSGRGCWRPSAPTRAPAPSRRTSARRSPSLEKEQKTRATRFTRDVVDRALVDLLSVYRDALVLRTGADIALVNEDSRQVVQRARERASTAEAAPAARWTPSATARDRIGANVNPLLALEAMALQLRLPR